MSVSSGVYLNQKPEAIRATITLLRHFRVFLNSECTRMHDPYSGWMKTELTKFQAQRKLEWLVDVAINRKAGIQDTLPVRKDDPDYLRHLRQFAYRINTPRLIVRYRDCPVEYRKYLADRLTWPSDETW